MESRDTAPVPPSASVRFEATLGPTPYSKAVAAANALDLDRLPDVKGQVRLLVTADDARRLLESGFEVHLVAAARVGPLDPKLVMSDKDAAASLEARVKGIPREGGR